MKINLPIELDDKTYKHLVSDIAEKITQRHVKAPGRPITIEVVLSDEAIEKSFRPAVLNGLRLNLPETLPVIPARGLDNDGRIA